MLRASGNILALAAMLILVGIQLSPAITPFFAKDGQTIEICTLQGIKTISLGGAKESDGNSHEQADIAHCPLSLLRVAAYLAPTTIVMAAPVPQIEHIDFTVSEHRSDSVEYTPNSTPRAPPARLS